MQRYQGWSKQGPKKTTQDDEKNHQVNNQTSNQRTDVKHQTSKL